MYMRRIFLTLLALAVLLLAHAQKPPKFDPERFQADLEQFITTQAALTPAESAVFFPLYREMREKQMAYIGEARRMRFVDMNNEEACIDIIRQRDKNEIEMKKLQRDYHLRFLKILPATKVLRILKAEDDFHRRLFKKCDGGHAAKTKHNVKRKK